MSIAPENPAAAHPHDDLEDEETDQVKYVCFYCHGHVYKAEKKGCPQCGRTISSDPVDQVLGAEHRGSPETLDELFDDLTYEKPDFNRKTGDSNV